MQTPATKWLATALIALGVLSAVAGTVGMVRYFASEDQPESSASTEPTSTTVPDVTPTSVAGSSIPSTTTSVAASSIPSTTSSTTSTTGETVDPVDPGRVVDEFFSTWASAIGEADFEFLLAALHPAVLERYGTEQCAAYLREVAGQPIEVEVLSTSELLTGEFARDGLTRVVDDLVLVEISRRDRGAEEAVVQQTRVGFVDGEVRWFTDCGEPLEGAP